MQAKRLPLTVALGMGLVLTLALLMALSPSSEVARAWPVTPAITPKPPITRPSGPAFVKPGSTGGWCLQNDPCGSIQYAINECEPGNGDTIYVAGGTYTSTGTAVITVTKSITLYGGWDGSTTTPVVRDPNTHITILDGENGRRVVYITSTVTPILEGLTLQRGDASGLGGDPALLNFDFGGAIYANNGSPVITGCRILSSTAGFGGGLALYHGTPTVSNGVVLNNTASQSATGQLRGVGGGMFLYHSPATIIGNIVMNNVASGTQIYDGGGGLYLDNSAAVIRGNTIQGNHGFPYGGGLFIYRSGAVVHGNTIQDNNAPNGDGGGAFVELSTASFEANTILNNEACTVGGGLKIIGCAPFTLTNNFFALNHTLSHAPALYVVGDPSQYSRGTLLHNTFCVNHSVLPPWMIYVGSSTGPTATLAFTNTIIDKPGGVYVDQTGSAMLDTTLWHLSLLLYPGATITGPGTIISSTNYYSDPGLTGPTFRISPGSAAIDQGANAGVTTDIDGEGRPNGAGYDIGADEFYCYGLTNVGITGPTTGTVGTAYAFTATVSPPTATLPITYTWQATGLTPVTHTIYALSDMTAFTWSIADTQYITVTAANCGGSDVVTHTITISPQQRTIYLPVVLRGYSNVSTRAPVPRSAPRAPRQSG